MHAFCEKGLCYNSGEVYSFGHRCNSKQVFMLLGDGSDSKLDQVASDSPVDQIESLESSSSTDVTLKLEGTVK